MKFKTSLLLFGIVDFLVGLILFIFSQVDRFLPGLLIGSSLILIIFHKNIAGGLIYDA